METVVCEVCMRTIPKANATVIPAIGFMCPEGTAECVAVPLSERIRRPWFVPITVERWVVWNPRPGALSCHGETSVRMFESFEDAEYYRSSHPTWVTSPVYTEV